MKVTVKKIPVRYNGKTYREGESFDMAEKYFDENLVQKAGRKSTKEDEDNG